MKQSLTKRSRTQYIILGMLTQGPQTGYELQKNIKRSTGFFWQESFGQLYPTLAKLTKGGLVGKEVVKKDARGKKRYALTPKGKKALSEWLSAPFTRAVQRNEFLLKMFFGANVSKETTLGHLKHAFAEAQAMVAVMEPIKDLLKNKYPDDTKRFYFESTVDFGISRLSAEAEWCKKMISKLERL